MSRWLPAVHAGSSEPSSETSSYLEIASVMACVRAIRTRTTGALVSIVYSWTTSPARPSAMAAWYSRAVTIAW